MSTPTFSRLPKPLVAGDTVEVVAPGGAVDQQALDAGLALLKAQGLIANAAFVGDNRHFYFAAALLKRRDHLAHAWQKRPGAVWAARGGYGSAHVAAQITLGPDQDVPPWLVGFSDITALHMQAAKLGIFSIHGAGLCTLPNWAPDHQQELFDLLSQRGEGELVYPGEGGWSDARLPEATGPLVGGNITVLASMAGTGMLPPLAGCIVMLEDVGEKPYRLHRSLSQLVMAQAFRGAKGIAIGQLSHCEDDRLDYSSLQMVHDALAPLDLPSVWGLPFGHAPTSRAVVLGAQAHLDTKASALVVKTPWP